MNSGGFEWRGPSKFGLEQKKKWCCRAQDERTEEGEGPASIEH